MDGENFARGEEGDALNGGGTRNPYKAPVTGNRLNTQNFKGDPIFYKMAEESSTKTKKHIMFGARLFLDIVLFIWCLALEIVITVLILVGVQKQKEDILFGYDKGLFEWHPSLCAVAIIIIMSNGMISFSFLFFLPDIIRKLWHAFCMISWLCLAIAGFGIIIRCKVEIDDDHFMETHERLGLILIAISLLQAAVGILKLCASSCKVSWLGWHARLGPFLYVIGLATVCTGVQLTFEIETEEYNVYYDPTYYNGTAYTAPPYYTEIEDLSDYSTTIYVLTAVLGITVLFYYFWNTGCDIIPKLEKKKVERSKYSRAERNLEQQD